MEGGWYFTRGETLGLISNGDEKIPLIKAPLVDYQFAGIMRDRILVQCRDVVLRELQDKIYEHQNQNVFAIFIASFVLLNTYELLSRQQIDFGSLIRAPVLNTLLGEDLLRLTFSRIVILRLIYYAASIMEQRYCLRISTTAFED